MKNICLIACLWTTTAAAATVGCIGTCGTDTGNGDILAAPGYNSYSYVTSTNGVTGGGTIPVGATGAETNGSTLTTATFFANPGDILSFNFNYITSDGAGFSDYAWAELETAAGVPVALLFTAETQPNGNTAPAPDLPKPVATLNPAAAPIKGNATNWSQLGGSSGQCYSGGCGSTGWISSLYTVTTAGNYQLAFGATNQLDTGYDTGLAIAGITIAGQAVGTADIPEPSTFALLAMGFAGLGIVRRKACKG